MASLSSIKFGGGRSLQEGGGGEISVCDDLLFVVLMSNTQTASKH